jgi:hypothetical protein
MMSHLVRCISNRLFMNGFRDDQDGEIIRPLLFEQLRDMKKEFIPSSFSDF